MSRLIWRWLALLIVVLAVVVVAREPLFWKRYALSAALLVRDPPLSLYEPRERIEGVGAAQQPHVTPEEAHIDPAALKAAADYAEARNSTALIVSRHGHIVYEKFWQNTGFDTLGSTDSFNRTIAAFMIGVALDDHKIGSIDEPAANYLPQWRDDARRAITIRHLLQMSSGLEAASPSHLPWSQSVRQRLGTDIVREYLQRPLASPPGTQWREQSADPQWLAVIVERATGERYAKYVSRMLWKRFQGGAAWIWLDRPGGMAHAECCLIARQSDWMRVAQLLLTDGQYQGEQILPAGWAQAMLQPAPLNHEFGFQVWRGVPRDGFYLAGAGKNRLWLVPSLELAVLRLGSEPDKASDWDETRLPNLVVSGVQDRPTPSATDLSKLVPNH